MTHDMLIACVGVVVFAIALIAVLEAMRGTFNDS